jgi:glycosyltransferase involved in cell wall biosynthesis
VSPLVSVILPVRNAAATLAPAVASIRVQTLTDWELILVNDGSTDGTSELAERLAREELRVKVRHQAPLGLVPALHCALAEARGRFIARMDADDLSYPSRLAAQAAFLEHHPELGVAGCLVEFGGDRQIGQGYALHVDWLNGLRAPDDIALNRFIESPFAHPSVMFRRELFRQLGSYADGHFPEDYELWLRWLDAGVRMAKVPEILVRWNDSPGRLSRCDPRYSLRAFYAVKARYLARAVERTRGSRAVWVWGAGRPTRVRAELLTQHGIVICGYLDIDPRTAGRVLRGRPIVGPDSLPRPEEAVVLAYVAKRGARELIRPQLVAAGYREGRDFWMAA